MQLTNRPRYLLRTILQTTSYDPATGVICINGRATRGTRTPSGDLEHTYYVDGKRHRVKHKHLAWLLAYGDWPESPIGFVNDDKTDLRLSNLMQRTPSETQAGKHKTRGRTSSRYKGVFWSRGMKKWAAQIMYQRHSYPLGHYDDEDLAANVYNAAARTLFGEHARLNPCPPRPTPPLGEKLRKRDKPQGGDHEPPKEHVGGGGLIESL